MRISSFPSGPVPVLVDPETYELKKTYYSPSPHSTYYGQTGTG